MNDSPIPKELRVASHCKGAVRFEWPNGNYVSIVFGPGTYTRNYDLDLEEKYRSGRIISDCVEVMVSDGELEQWLEDHLEEDATNPAGYVPIEKALDLLQYAHEVGKTTNE